MPEQKFIEHVTLSTGHVRRSPRSEVADEIVGMLVPHIEAIKGGAKVALFEDEPYQINGVISGQWAAITLWREDAPLLTVGVCWHSRSSRKVWQRLHVNYEGPYLATDPKNPPPIPWCAARIEKAGFLLGLPEWAGDFERCMAWALIEGKA